jgi:hypothetical protein
MNICICITSNNKTTTQINFNQKLTFETKDPKFELSLEKKKTKAHLL